MGTRKYSIDETATETNEHVPETDVVAVSVVVLLVLFCHRQHPIIPYTLLYSTYSTVLSYLTLLACAFSRDETSLTCA